MPVRDARKGTRADLTRHMNEVSEYSKDLGAAAELCEEAITDFKENKLTVRHCLYCSSTECILVLWQVQGRIDAYFGELAAALEGRHRQLTGGD